jgi:hypothetical protein
MASINENKQFGFADAVRSLLPEGTQWSVRGNSYEGIEIHTEGVELPSEDDLIAEFQRLQAEFEYNRYQRLRSREYPPVADYLDAVVKGDEVQKQAYIDACLAIKEKYPKPD